MIHLSLYQYAVREKKTSIRLNYTFLCFPILTFLLVVGLFCLVDCVTFWRIHVGNGSNKVVDDSQAS